MANTRIATPMDSDERVAQFRSGDDDPGYLFDVFGEVRVYDLTDEMKLLYFVVSDHMRPGGYRVESVEAIIDGSDEHHAADIGGR